MSDTPRTDAEVFAVDVAFVSHDGLASEPKNVVEPDFARQLERENAALREAFAKAEVLWKHAGRHGEKEFAYVSGYFHPGEIIVFVDCAAIDAARAKEGGAS